MSATARRHEVDADDPRRGADTPLAAENSVEMGGYAAPLYVRALVVFGGRTDLKWLRWLRPGFRHCFAALDDGAMWLTVDPLLHRLEVRASGLASDFDLAGEYRRRDLAVVEVAPGPVLLRRAPLGLFTCVEAVKRLLGIRARWVLTPWQLYRLLTAPAGALRHTRSGEARQPRSAHVEQNRKIILTTGPLLSMNKDRRYENTSN